MFAIDRFTPRIWKVSCSNTKADNPDRFFMVFLTVCLQIPGYDLKSHHDRFLSHAFQFVLRGTDSKSHKPLARTALFCAITQRSGNFLPKFRDNLLVPWPLKMGSISCPETSVMNYQYSLRNNAEERSSHPFLGGSLKLPPKTTNKFKSHLVVLII